MTTQEVKKAEEAAVELVSRSGPVFAKDSNLSQAKAVKASALSTVAEINSQILIPGSARGLQRNIPRPCESCFDWCRCGRSLVEP